MRSSALLAVVLALLISTSLARAAAPGSPEPVEGPQLIAYTVQRDTVATLTIGVFATEPTEVTIGVQLPVGWIGAEGWSGVVTSTLLLSYPLARGNAPPGLGTIVVRANEVEKDAYLAGPIRESAAPLRPSVRRLPLVRR